jgi:type II secretory ATPase GspE/PulE/Tfp pilus assembly ATPase PilB-like protein
MRFALPDGAHKPELFRAAGCIDCLAGYRGHKLLFEAFSASPAIRETIAGAAERIDYRTLHAALLGEGLVPLRQKALDMVCSGVTSVDELLPFVD